MAAAHDVTMAALAQVLILSTPSWDPPKQREQIKAMAASLGPGAKGKLLIDVINGLNAWPSLALE